MNQDTMGAFEAEVVGTTLKVAIRREFDNGQMTHDWAIRLINAHPGPFHEVRIDLSRCVRVSSTFFAGMVQLHAAYTGKGAKPLVLVNADPATVKNLKVLHLDKLFFFVDE
jgi:hypothetical protein